MGGTRRPDTCANLLLLCGSGTTGCHGWVESNRFAARAVGLLVSQRADPAQVPVLLRGGWWLLTEEGRAVPVDPPSDAPADL